MNLVYQSLNSLVSGPSSRLPVVGASLTIGDLPRNVDKEINQTLGRSYLGFAPKATTNGLRGTKERQTNVKFAQAVTQEQG